MLTGSVVISHISGGGSPVACRLLFSFGGGQAPSRLGLPGPRFGGAAAAENMRAALLRILPVASSSSGARRFFVQVSVGVGAGALCHSLKTGGSSPGRGRCNSDSSPSDGALGLMVGGGVSPGLHPSRQTPPASVRLQAVQRFCVQAPRKKGLLVMA